MLVRHQRTDVYTQIQFCLGAGFSSGLTIKEALDCIMMFREVWPLDGYYQMMSHRSLMFDNLLFFSDVRPISL